MTRLRISAALLAVASAATSSILAAASTASEFCPTIYAEFGRRQLAQFSSEEPFVLVEGGTAKHVPFLTISDDGKTGTVVVGNGDEEGGVWHPMTASDDPAEVHFVTHIMVKDQDGKVIATESLDPTVEAPAKMTFSVPPGVTEMTPYEWCNLHGLWIGEPVAVPAAATSEETGVAVCSVSDYPEGAWESVHADFMRQQEYTFKTTDPFTESDGEKHTPYITESDGEKHTPYITLNDDSTASILVGKVGGEIHPMNGSPDGTGEPHWITEIYVVNHLGNIVFMSSLDPTGVDMATLDFDVPEGAESLQAYSWCNLHGLWKGPVVDIKAASSDEAAQDISPGVDKETTSDVSLFAPSVFVTLAAALLVACVM